MLKHNKEIYRHFKNLIKRYLDEDDSGSAKKFFSNPMSENGSQFANECAYLIKGVEIARGATKICFIEEGYPYVLKIGFVCDKGFCGKYYVGEEVSLPFEITNYCFLEAYLYERAAEYDVQDILAETRYLGTFMRVALFCAEKFEICPSRLNGDLCEANEDYCDGDFSDNPEDYLGDLLDYYGYADKINLFQTWAQDYDIGDFHDENWGYDECGDFKCIDFSGYVGGVSYGRRREIA